MSYYTLNIHKPNPNPNLNFNPMLGFFYGTKIKNKEILSSARHWMKSRSNYWLAWEGVGDRKYLNISKIGKNTNTNNFTHKEPRTQGFQRITLPTEGIQEWPNSSLHKTKHLESKGWWFKTQDRQAGVLNLRDATLLVRRIKPSSAVFWDIFLACLGKLKHMGRTDFFWGHWTLKCYCACCWTRSFNHRNYKSASLSTELPADSWRTSTGTFIPLFWAIELQNGSLSTADLIHQPWNSEWVVLPTELSVDSCVLSTGEFIKLFFDSLAWNRVKEHTFTIGCTISEGIFCRKNLKMYPYVTKVQVEMERSKKLQLTW